MKMSRDKVYLSQNLYMIWRGEYEASAARLGLPQDQSQRCYYDLEHGIAESAGISL